MFCIKTTATALFPTRRKKRASADGRWSVGSAFGDFDADGFLDLIVINYVDFKFNDLPTFGSMPTCKFRGVDVQCGPRGLKGAGDSLFKNNGDGTFTDVSKQSGMNDADGYYGMQPVWSDFGNTGKLDAYVANDSTPNYFYRNAGGGKFLEEGLITGMAVSGDGSEQGSMGVAVGDYLHTGNFSIYATNFVDEYNTLYRNNGKYDFMDVSFTAKVAQVSRPYVGWGTGFFDLDNDTWLDLFVVNGHVYPQMDQISSGLGYKQGKLLFINNGDGTFCDGTKQGGAILSEPRVSRGAAFGDLNNDGFVDAVVTNLGEAPTILLNTSASRNQSVTFKLVQSGKNKDGVGARVIVKTDKRLMTRSVEAGASYLSQNDFRLHFGFPNGEKILSVEARWSDGKTEAISGVAPNKILTVTQNKGVTGAGNFSPR